MFIETPHGQLSAETEIVQKPEEISDYFRRLGLALRDELKILKAPQFEVSGMKAKREGWFIGYHSVVESAFVLKVAELANLSEEETSLLLQAAMLHDANKRNMYVRDKAATTKERFDSRLKGEVDLAKMGVDPRILIISRGVGSDFPLRFLGAEPKMDLETDPAIFRLEAFLSYIHNSIETSISRASGKPTQKTEIVFWQERLRLAEIRHPEVAMEKTKIGDQEMSSFEIEAKSTGAIENELKRLINQNRPGAVDETTPLSSIVRREIMNDIRDKKAIKLPAR